MPELYLLGGNSRQFVYSLLRSSFPDVLNLSRVNFITPVVCVLFAVFRTLERQIVYPENSEARDYLNYMHRAHLMRGRNRYIPVVNLTSSQEIIGITQRFTEMFQDWLSPNASQFVSYGFSELMDNVFHHAQSLPGLWIQAQKYQVLDCIEMCLADLGRGIATSMSDNPAYASLLPEKRFAIALEVGETRAPEDHSGEGLSCVVRWIKENPSAEGILVSRQHIWLKTPEYNGIYKTGFISWPGTLVWIKIPKEPLYSLLDIWEILDLQPEFSI